MGTSKKLEGGVDSPRNFKEFETFFVNEAACREYVTTIRWPDGFLCPQCGSNEKPWKTGRGYFHCQRCHQTASVTAETMFERTKVPLKTWFLAIGFVTSQKNGVNA